MIVHFAAPSPLYERDPDLAQRIVKIIRASGHTSTMSESDHLTMIEMSSGMLEQEDWELMCKRHIRLSGIADAVIFEVSDKATFGAGYLAAHALAAGKPTLFLCREGAKQGSFTFGLKDKNLTRTMYVDDTLRGAITDFFEGIEK